MREVDELERDHVEEKLVGNLKMLALKFACCMLKLNDPDEQVRLPAAACRCLRLKALLGSFTSRQIFVTTDCTEEGKSSEKK